MPPLQQPLGRGEGGFTTNKSPNLSAPLRSNSGSGMDTKRKQTLLTIPEALHELKAASNFDVPSVPTRSNIHLPGARPEVDDEPKAPTIMNESLEKEGAEGFLQFQRRIKDLDRELRSVANATPLLGSSVGILNSATHLRHNLFQVLLAFQENAATLFHNKVKRPAKVYPDYNNTKNKKHAARKHHQQYRIGKIHKRNPFVVRSIPPEDLGPEDIPSLFDQLAEGLVKFHDRLNEFPEFSDISLNISLMAFAGDLRYWSDSLEEYKCQFRYPSIGSYLHDLSAEMGEHLDHITTSLGTFVEVGVPAIQLARKHWASNLQNLSTVATFLSAVTATTLQISFITPDGLGAAVNSFWFASLVFSIASAVNSSLGLTLKQTMNRSPGHRVPWWVRIWINRSPQIFLVLAVCAFSIGLVLFAYASHQAPVTRIITTVFAASTTFGLIAVLLWFAFEKWTYSRHYNQRWLAEILSEGYEEAVDRTGMKWLAEVVLKHARKASEATRSYTKRLSSMLQGRMLSHESTNSDMEEGLSLPVTNQDLYLSGFPHLASTPAILTKQLSEGSTFKAFESAQKSPDVERPPPPQGSVSPTNSILLAPTSGDSAPNIQGTSSPDGRPVRTGKQLCQSATRIALMSRALSKTAPATSTPQVTKRQLTTSSIPSADGKAIAPYLVLSHRHLTRVITTLGRLEIAQEFGCHQELIKHIQFSSDGKWLATCNWDRTSYLFKISTNDEDSCTPHKVLPHPTGFAGQVAWSPDGSPLLSKLTRSIKVWTSKGTLRNTIERPRLVQFITWMPQRDGYKQAFMSVEGSAVYTVDVHGKELAAYVLDRLQIYDIAVTPNAKRFLGVVFFLESKDKPQPPLLTWNWDLVYNLEENEIESQVPVLNEIRDITLESDGLIALVSYENIAHPQLWRLLMVRDDVRLSLIRTFMPQKPMMWAGVSYFGGSDNQLLLCAGKGGCPYLGGRIAYYQFKTHKILREKQPTSCKR